MDPLDNLIRCAIHQEVDSNKNPYVTLETIIQRLYQKIITQTRVQPHVYEKTKLFVNLHDEIVEAYDALKGKLQQEERACIERVLSKDCPHTAELTKFATCWNKYNPNVVLKWFAVDGILGNHHKHYIQDAFSPKHAKHNDAVRTLYAYFSDPEQVKEIVERAFSLVDGEPCSPHPDPDIERCVGMYAEMVGEEDMRAIAEERKKKLVQQQQQQQQPNKRKKKSSTQQQDTSEPNSE